MTWPGIASRRVAAFLGLAAVLASTVAAYGQNNPHYGAQRRQLMSSIKALTFYNGEVTNYRRTAPAPQLQCYGKPCERYQPDVISCQSLGDGQWKCRADLPSSIRLGRVEVSCEGYDSASDPYVLQGSCGLSYHLLPAYNAFGAEEDHLRFKQGNSHRNQGLFQEFLDNIFPFLFIGSLIWIIYSFCSSVLRSTRSSGSRDGSGRGGGGGGGGGGWGPGWGGGGGGNGPPPPYSKTDPGGPEGASSSWRPGFWSGLAAGAAGATLANRYGDQGRRRADAGYDPYFAGGPAAGWGAGPSTRVGSSSSDSGPSMMRSSEGYGGTRNR